MRRRMALGILCVLGLAPWLGSSACVVYSPVATRPPTLGEELLSLDLARRDGLLTQEEFELRRTQTIERWKAIGFTPVEERSGPGLPPPAAASEPAPAAGAVPAKGGAS